MMLWKSERRPQPLRAALLVTALATAGLPGALQAQQIGLHCTVATTCGAETGCTAGEGEITAFVNPLGNPDKAIVHYDGHDTEARRVDTWAAFSFRQGGKLVSLQFFDDYRRFSLLEVSDQTTSRTLSGTCEAL